MGHTKAFKETPMTQQDQTTITLTLAAIPILATLTIASIQPFDHHIQHPLEFGARKSAQHNLAFA